MRPKHQSPRNMHIRKALVIAFVLLCGLPQIQKAGAIKEDNENESVRNKSFKKLVKWYVLKADPYEI